MGLHGGAGASQLRSSEGGHPMESTGATPSFYLSSTTAFPLPALPRVIGTISLSNQQAGQRVSEIRDRTWASAPSPAKPLLSSPSHPRGRRGGRREWEETVGALDIWPGTPQTTGKLPGMVIKSEAPQSLFLLLTRLESKNKSQAHRGTSPLCLAQREHLLHFAQKTFHLQLHFKTKSCLQTAFKKRERGPQRARGQS